MFRLAFRVRLPKELIDVSTVPAEFCHSCRFADWDAAPRIIKPTVEAEPAIPVICASPEVVPERT
jgi:hypothetical protein